MHLPVRRLAALIAALGLVVPTMSAAAGSLQPNVFIRGAPIHGANGLAATADGDVWVASVWGQELIRVDARSGRILERVGPMADGAPIGGPDDVAIGPDGSVYWTDILGGRVGRLAPDGSVTTQLVAAGMNPIAFNDDGRLFVAQAFFGDGLYEIDPELVDPPRTIIPDSGAAGAPWPFQLNGFDFGPDGMLYAPRPFVGQLVRIDVETGDLEILTNEFAGEVPTSVEFDRRGRLHLDLQETGEILSYDLSSGTTNLVAELEPGLDNMVFDAWGNLVVSHATNGSVFRVLPNGNHRVLVGGGVILPGGIAISGDTRAGELFVADLWSMSWFDARTGRLSGVQQQSFATAGIVEPWSVAAFGEDLVLTSWMSNAVQVWDPEAGVEVARFPAAVPLNAIEFGDAIAVSELGTSSVVAVEPGSGARTTLATLAVPTGLAGTDGDLWVADWAIGAVFKIVEDGSPVGPIPVVFGLASPEGLAIGVDGSLLVVEAGEGRVTRIDPATGSTSVFAEGLGLGRMPPPGLPPTWAFNGIAVAPDGTVYVTGDVAGVVYRFR